MMMKYAYWTGMTLLVLGLVCIPLYYRGEQVFHRFGIHYAPFIIEEEAWGSDAHLRRTMLLPDSQGRITEESKRLLEEYRRANPIVGYFGVILILSGIALMIGAVMAKKRRGATTNLLFGIRWPKDRYAFWMGIGIGAIGVALAAFYYGGHRLFDSLGIYGIPMVIGDDPGDTYRQLRDAGQIPSPRTHPAFGYLGAIFIYIGAVLSFALYPFRKEDDAFARLLSSIRLERISGSVLARHIPLWLGTLVATYVPLMFFYSPLVASCVSVLVATFVRFMSHQFGSGQVTWSTWFVMASLGLWVGAQSIENVEHEVVRIILNQVSGLMRFVFAASSISLSVGVIRWLHRARHSFEESERFWESPDGRLLARARLKLAALGQRGDSTSVAYASQLQEAMERGDYFSIGEILRDEDAYAIATANRGLRQYEPSGGRPTVVELSGRPERRSSEAPDRDEWGTRADGIEAESLAVRRLEGILDESWTIIRGYRNSRGETDVLVVGPYGICAIEVVNYQGVISAEESSWSGQRYGRYGGPTGSPAPMEDATGRSPSDQINGASDAIERLLSSRFEFPVSVRRVVVLTHDRCELGSICEPGVDAVLKIDHVTPASIFSGRSYDLGAEQVDRLAALIQQDHAFNAERESEPEQGSSVAHSHTAASRPFINRKMMIGLGVAAFSLIIAAIVFWFTASVIDTSKDPQLVALVPSRGYLILENLGDSYSLGVKGQFSDLTAEDLDPQDITYRPADPAVVIVSQEGLVTATGEGATDVAIEYGGIIKSVRALVFGDIPTPPPIDPAMVGPIPDLDGGLRAVLNRIIVELHPGYGIDDADAIASELGGDVLLSYRTFPGHVIEFNAELHTLLDTLDDLSVDDRVATAYPDIFFEAAGDPIDSESLGAQAGSQYFQMGFVDAWRAIEGIQLNRVVIAVHEHGEIFVPENNTSSTSTLDQELNFNRIVLDSKGRGSSNEHKAAVLSLIAAENHKLTAATTNYRNFSGIVSSVDGLDYYIFALSGPEVTEPALTQLTELADVLSKLEVYHRLSHEIDVFNMSWGARLDEETRQEKKYRDLMNRFEKLIGAFPTTTFVVGAGNCGKDAKEFFPASLSYLDNVITVGGANFTYDGRWTDPSAKPKCIGAKGVSSNHGNAITIAARAEKILAIRRSPLGQWEYGFQEGTSFAAPMVTGAVALLRSIYPELRPKEIKDLLVETADIELICKSSSAANSSCSAKDQANWHFLRTDKAVDELLSSCVSETTPTGVTPATVPLDCSGFREYNVMLLAETSGVLEDDELEKIKEAIQSFVIEMSKDPSLGGVGLSSFDDTKYETVMPNGPIGPACTAPDNWKKAVDGLTASGGDKRKRYDAITQAVRDLENLGRPRNNVLVAFMDSYVEGTAYEATLRKAIDSVIDSEVSIIFLTVQGSSGALIIDEPFWYFMDQDSREKPRVFYAFDAESDVGEIYKLLSRVRNLASTPKVKC